MTYHERIEINPLICSGKPVIKGTRIIVSDLLIQLATGETFARTFVFLAQRLATLVR